MGRPRKNQQKNDTDNQTSQSSTRERSNSTSSEISTSSIVSIDKYNYEDASFTELVTELRKVINGGTTTTTDQGGSKYRAYIKMDLSHKANKLIDAMEFKYHLPSSQHHVKETKDSSCITMIETSEQGMQTLPTKQQAKPTSEDLVELKTASYATTLKKNIEVPKQRPIQPTVLLYHKELYNEDNQQLPKKGIEHLLRENLSCNEISFSNIKTVRNNGIAITCRKEEDVQALLDKIENSESLNNVITARKPAKRHPSIIIYGIPDQTTNEEVQDSLRHHTGIDKDLKIRFKLRGRTQGTSHWVLETPSEEFKKTTSIKKLPINWSMHNIREFFHIKKCQKCHAYGHLFNSCKNIKPFCGFCGNRHPISQCRASIPCCINCNDENRRKGTKHRTDHTASSQFCTIYMKNIKTYKATRDY
ncbi:hypothetical protein AVEN_33273-1 [Araneus ventricosus]|uniref:CCHC-type domain-containing protein n=1 Tax=Araneus ventricosus TaxID=182803 RepID=A0A4Y2WHA3_ARAVE|nr:hypothetical protein AVEN_256337-1 [Araneus ventricosus]GBO36333.1 hypothetical protein AVEN_33273-1 [Araneus ventricosus]